MSDGPPEPERRSLSAAHKPQHIARFRKLGKRRFPILRREAASQHPRWEAKRPQTMSLTQEDTADHPKSHPSACKSCRTMIQ